MPCNLFITVRGKIRGEKYKSLDDLAVAYESVPDKHQPAWAYDEAGALVLGVEPEGFERPTARSSPTKAPTDDLATAILVAGS